MSDIKPFAFVLMPFSNDFRDTYNLGIKATANELGIIAERVDEQHYSEPVLERIYRQIDTCDFIIADMTGQNPNVFYEVGYAHAKSKLCALITKDAKDIPFDLKHHTHVIYDGSVSDLKEQLLPKLQWMKEEFQKQKTETISLKLKVSDETLTNSEYTSVGSMNLSVNLKNNSEKRSPEIEAIYITTSDTWEMKKNDLVCPSEQSDDATKRHLVAPDLRRLSPGAFCDTKVKMSKRFWSKFGGDELKDNYESKGWLLVEIVTSEGTFKHENAIEVLFEEFPF